MVDFEAEVDQRRAAMLAMRPAVLWDPVAEVRLRRRMRATAAEVMKLYEDPDVTEDDVWDALAATVTLRAEWLYFLESHGLAGR